MSLSLTRSWARSAIHHPEGLSKTLEFFEQANNRTCTVVVGRDLNPAHRAYLARWDGIDLVVQELTAEMQQAWNIRPTALILQRDSEDTLLAVVSTERRYSLSVEQIRLVTGDAGQMCVKGICRYACDSPAPLDFGCAIQAHYFRPNIGAATRRQHSGLCPVDRILGSPGGILPFEFDLPWLDRTDLSQRQPLALFLQIFTAENWEQAWNCRRMSNLTSAFVEIW